MFVEYSGVSYSKIPYRAGTVTYDNARHPNHKKSDRVNAPNQIQAVTKTMDLISLMQYERNC